jgi:hypothetical protein
MWVREFGGVRWIIDYEHTKNRLSECAAVIHPPGAALSKLFGHWEGLLYDGHMDKLLRELMVRAEERSQNEGRQQTLDPDRGPRYCRRHRRTRLLRRPLG